MTPFAPEMATGLGLFWTLSVFWTPSRNSFLERGREAAVSGFFFIIFLVLEIFFLSYARQLLPLPWREEGIFLMAGCLSWAIGKWAAREAAFFWILWFVAAFLLRDCEAGVWHIQVLRAFLAGSGIALSRLLFWGLFERLLFSAYSAKWKEPVILLSGAWLLTLALEAVFKHL